MMRPRFLCLLALLAALNGCETANKLFGQDEKKPLPGERLAVLRESGELSADPSLTETPSLPVAVDNESWSQRGGNGANYVPNIFALAQEKPALAVLSKGEAGGGKGWSLPLVVSPIIIGERVYSMDAQNVIAAHPRQELGKRLWQHKMPKMGKETFAGGGLAFIKGKLLAVSGYGQVVALDGETGKLLWERELRLPVRSAPKADLRHVYIKTVDNQSFALDLETGMIAWKHQGISEAAGLLGAPTPAIEDTIVVMPYSSGELYGLDAESGRELWREMLIATQRTAGGKRITDMAGSPILTEGRIFAATQAGQVASLDARGGLRVWEREFPGVRHFALSGHLLLVLTNDNRLVALRADDGRIHWVRELPGYKDKEAENNWFGAMVLSSKIAVFGNDGRILLLSPEKGEVIRSVGWPKSIHHLPSVAATMLFAVTDDATLYALQ